MTNSPTTSSLSQSEFAITPLGLRHIDYDNSPDSCWNGRIGRNGDESHMRYAPNFRPEEDNGVTTDCTEASHPYKVARLFYEVMVSVDADR